MYNIKFLINSIMSNCVKFIEDEIILCYNLPITRLIKIKRYTMIQIQTITEAICYILQEIAAPTEKMKIIKLLFLADKYHLLTAGRTITDDNFVAMQHGPVGSKALNVLDCDDEWLSDEAQKYIKEYICIIDTRMRSLRKKIDKFQMLSISDKKAIDFILSKFGKMTASELRNYTHQYPEWKKFEDDFKKHNIEQEPIETQELFSIIDNRLNVSKDTIETSKDIFFNNYD